MTRRPVGHTRVEPRVAVRVARRDHHVVRRIVKVRLVAGRGGGLPPGCIEVEQIALGVRSLDRAGLYGRLVPACIQVEPVAVGVCLLHRPELGHVPRREAEVGGEFLHAGTRQVVHDDGVRAVEHAHRQLLDARPGDIRRQRPAADAGADPGRALRERLAEVRNRARPGDARRGVGDGLYVHRVVPGGGFGRIGGDNGVGGRDAEAVGTGVSAQEGIGAVGAEIDAFAVFVHARPVEGVVAGAAEQYVDPHATGDEVEARAALDHVVAGVPVQAVVAGTAVDPVVAVAAIDRILPGAAVNFVVPRPALDAVAVLDGGNDAARGLAGQAERGGGAGIDVDRLQPGTLRTGVALKLDHPRIVLSAGRRVGDVAVCIGEGRDGCRHEDSRMRVVGQGQGMQFGLHLGRARVPRDRVCSLPPVLELEAAAGRVVPDGLLVVGLVAAGDQVVAVAAEKDVVAGGAGEGVVAAAAVDPVVAVAAVDGVVAGAADQDIVAALAVQPRPAGSLLREAVVAGPAVELDLGAHVLGDDDLVVTRAGVADDLRHADIAFGEVLERYGGDLGDAVGGQLVADFVSFGVVLRPVRAAVAGARPDVEREQAARDRLVIDVGRVLHIVLRLVDHRGRRHVRRIHQVGRNTAVAKQLEAVQRRLEQAEVVLEQRDLGKPEVEPDPQEGVQADRELPVHVEQALRPFLHAVQDFDEAQLAVAPVLAGLFDVPGMVVIRPDRRVVIEIEVDGHRDVAFDPGLDQAAQAE